MASQGLPYSLISPSVDQVSEYLRTLFGCCGQGAYAQLDAAQLVEVTDQRIGRDADEAGRESALRHERRVGALRDASYATGHRHVLGQVEVVRSRSACGLGDGDVAVVRQARDDGLDRVGGGVRGERLRVAGVESVGVQVVEAVRGHDGIAPRSRSRRRRGRRSRRIRRAVRRSANRSCRPRGRGPCAFGNSWLGLPARPRGCDGNPASGVV